MSRARFALQSMYLLYSLALSLLFIALLPYFAYQALRHGKYAHSFKQRLGWLPGSLRSDGCATIWVHAVSVGEFLAARPLIGRLKRELPASRLIVSTTTLTGQTLAASQSELFDGVFYFPFDWKFAVQRTIRWLDPSIVIILETEIWPNFLRECRRRGVATVLANGRISPRSFRRYLQVRPFIKRVLGDFSMMVMQSEADAERARRLGTSETTLRVCGNLKYDQTPTSSYALENQDESSIQLNQELDNRFALCSTRHLIVAGSTAPEEESLLLDVLRQVRDHRGLEGARMIIAPRHPERFNEVASLIARSGFTFVRRAQATPPIALATSAANAPSTVPDANADAQADVILLDSIGELAAVYRFASAVFVGGSLVPRGGHNIIEPAAFAKPVIVGPHTENFHEIVSDFARQDALVQLRDAGAAGGNRLAREMIRLLSDTEEANAMGQRAREILVASRGTTECTVAAIKEIIAAGQTLNAVVSNPANQ